MIQSDIQQSTFVYILADGSTDVSTKEQEVVYLLYVSDGEVKTQFVLDAARVTDGLDCALYKLGLSVSEISSRENRQFCYTCRKFVVTKYHNIK